MMITVKGENTKLGGRGKWPVWRCISMHNWQTRTNQRSSGFTPESTSGRSLDKVPKQGRRRFLDHPVLSAACSQILEFAAWRWGRLLSRIVTDLAPQWSVLLLTNTVHGSSATAMLVVNSIITCWYATSILSFGDVGHWHVMYVLWSLWRQHDHWPWSLAIGSCLLVYIILIITCISYLFKGRSDTSDTQLPPAAARPRSVASIP